MESGVVILKVSGVEEAERLAITRRIARARMFVLERHNMQKIGALD